MGAPTPAEVDEKAREFNRLKDDLDQATEAAKLKCVPLVALKQELIELVRDFGSPHAEKSKLLHGIKQEILITVSSSISIDAAAVERFRLALLESDQSRLLKRIFQEDFRWTMSPEAAVIIKGSKLSKSLLALYSQCEVIRQNTPSLKVREKSA